MTPHENGYLSKARLNARQARRTNGAARGPKCATANSEEGRSREMPCGVYFYRLDTPGFRSVKKAVVAR